MLGKAKKVVNQNKGAAATFGGDCYSLQPSFTESLKNFDSMSSYLSVKSNNNEGIEGGVGIHEQ